MKRILFAIAAALLMITACDPQDENKEVSLEGRWNAYPDDQPNDYRFSFIFKGNKLDVYIIAWGEHFSGTYTYADGKINYNITEFKKAWSGVTFDEQGNMTSYSWMAGDMDQETFALVEGYQWYDMSAENKSDRKDVLSSFDFKVDASGTKADCDLFGLQGMPFRKVK